MKFQLLQNLGLDDARLCNDKFNASLPVDAKGLTAGSTVDLPAAAVKYLTEGKGYTALLEPVGKITGEAKKPELTAPAK